MNFMFLEKACQAVVDHLIKNGAKYAEHIGTAIVASAIAVTAHAKMAKSLEKKHRDEDAKKYKAEFNKRFKELEEKYKHNEDLFKKKINGLCDEFDIPHVF